MPKHKIAPSILAADFGNLERDISMINQSESDWLHIDIMDGIFVPNISFGQAITKRMGELCEKPLDVHLMIMQPERYVEQFRDAGAEIITVHYEACPHLHRNLQQIKATGAKAGVALNPHTNVELLEDVLEDINMVCLMSVNPGFGGQKFIPETLNKTRMVRKLIEKSGREIRLEIDGGVKIDNIKQIMQAGADTFVAGSAIFNTDDYKVTIDAMRSQLGD